MRKIIVSIVFIAVIINPIFSQEISQFRGPNRNGVYTEKNLLTAWPKNGPELLWKYEKLGLGYASAAVTSNGVYTAGTIDSITYIFSFNKAGELLWKKPIGAEFMERYPGINSTPLIYGNLGYILTGLGKLYCFNTSNGDIVWTKDLFKDFDGENIIWGITENLLIDENKLYCTPGGKEYNVVALNRLTGKLIWKSQGNGEISDYCSPILINVGQEKYLITATDSSLLSINSNTGKLVWKYKLNIGHVYLPYYSNGCLFIMGLARPSGYLMLKLNDDGKSVKKIWSTEYNDWRDGSGVVMNNKIYGGNLSGGKLFCMDWNTGEMTDSVKIQSEASTLIAADNMIYSYGYDGDFSLLKHDKTGLKIVSTFKIDGEKRSHHT